MVKDQKQARYKKIMTSLSVSNFPNSGLYSHEVTITPKNKEKKNILSHCLSLSTVPKRKKNGLR